jgi:hypothetical protein
MPLTDGYSLAADTAARAIRQLALFCKLKRQSQRGTSFRARLDANDEIIAQVDREPGGELAPATIWQPGQRS